MSTQSKALLTKYLLVDCARDYYYYYLLLKGGVIFHPPKQKCPNKINQTDSTKIKA